MSPFGRQRARAYFLENPSESINSFKLAAIIRFDLDVSNLTRQGS